MGERQARVSSRRALGVRSYRERRWGGTEAAREAVYFRYTRKSPEENHQWEHVEARNKIREMGKRRLRREMVLT